MWTNYAKGVRLYCGHALPDNLVKNQQLSSPLLTPTTKSDEHDELISGEEVVAKGLMIAEDWSRCSELAHKLFALGQEKAASRGLILVDTKVNKGTSCLGYPPTNPCSARYSTSLVAIDVRARFACWTRCTRLIPLATGCRYKLLIEPYLDIPTLSPKCNSIGELSRSVPSRRRTREHRQGVPASLVHCPLRPVQGRDPANRSGRTRQRTVTALHSRVRSAHRSAIPFPREWRRGPRTGGC